MPAVSDASPLIALDYLGELELLPQVLAGEILISPAVAQEFSGAGWRRSQLPECVVVRELKQPVPETILRASLGAGESEGLALAIETAAELWSSRRRSSNPSGSNSTRQPKLPFHVL